MKGIKVLALTAVSLAAITSVTSSVAAISAPFGWYVEGNIGTTRAQNQNYGTSTTANTSGFGFNLDAGYKFMPYFGLEIGYTSYAQSQIKNPAGTKVAKDTLHSYEIDGKGILPISDSGLEFFAKIGMARSYSHIVITNGTGASGLGIPAGQKTSAGLYLGVGADYTFMPNLAVNLQWARAKGNSSTGNLDLYSVGINWLFN